VNAVEEVPKHNPVPWIQLLIGTVTATVVTVIADNAIKGEDTRPHNRTLLTNECLAEQHSSYLIFFFAIAISGGILSNSWAGFTLLIAVLLWLAFYTQGVRSTTTHQTKIAKDHVCTAGCTAELKSKTKRAIYLMNLVFALLLLGFGLFLCFMAVRAPAQ